MVWYEKIHTDRHTSIDDRFGIFVDGYLPSWSELQEAISEYFQQDCRYHPLLEEREQVDDPEERLSLIKTYMDALAVDLNEDDLPEGLYKVNLQLPRIMRQLPFGRFHQAIFRLADKPPDIPDLPFPLKDWEAEKDTPNYVQALFNFNPVYHPHGQEIAEHVLEGLSEFRIKAWDEYRDPEAFETYINAVLDSIFSVFCSPEAHADRELAELGMSRSLMPLTVHYPPVH